jgi:nucleoside-diphosphate kinase
MDGRDLEQSLVLIKPDALKYSLTGYVLSVLSEVHTGLRYAGAKIVHVNRMLAEEHYQEHRGKPFFPPLIDYIRGKLHYPGEAWKRRVIAIVYQGPDAIRKIRECSGPTNPFTAREERPGCIRSLGAVISIKDESGNVVGERMENLIHASASPVDAEREIKLWFKPNDIPPLMHGYPVVESDEHYYFMNGRLSLTHEPGSACILAPSDICWKSDFEALQALYKGAAASCPVESVVAKYLVNQGPEED